MSGDELASAFAKRWIFTLVNRAKTAVAQVVAGFQDTVKSSGNFTALANSGGHDFTFANRLKLAISLSKSGFRYTESRFYNS